MRFLKKYFAVLVGIFVFAVYIFTLAPSVVEIDSGELATVQATLSIAHPTGYPLFTMIGYLFSLLPLPFAKIYQLNLLAAVWCALGAGLFAYTCKLILDHPEIFGKKIKKDNNIKAQKKSAKDIKVPQTDRNRMPEVKKYLASLFGGLILAFDKTYWLQSTSVEVYSLQIFLFILIIFAALKAYISNYDPAKFSLKNPWLFVALTLALGFSNHMTTLFLLPGLAYIYFSKNGFSKKSFIGIGIMLLVFIPLLAAIYSYLPIRASQNPILDWGNPTSWSRFFRHAEAKQYTIWMFSSAKSAMHQLNYFISNLPDEFKLGLFLCAVGIITTFIRARKLFIFFTITFLFTVLYAVNYSIKDIDSYFVLSYISLSFFGMFGIVQIFSQLKAKKNTYLLPTVMIIIFVFTQGYLTFNEVNEGDLYTFKDYTKAVLNNCSKNAVIMSYQWDNFVSPSYYFQYVNKFRPDVTVVDKELLRRSWYYKQAAHDHPLLFKGMEGDVNSFLSAVAPFENGSSYDPNFIEMHYRKVLTDLVAVNITRGDVYIAPELFENEMQRGEFSLPEGYTLVPDLFMFKVVKGKKYVPAKDPDFTIRFPSEKNVYVRSIENFVASMLARRALYEMQYDKVSRAKIYIEKIRKSFPDYRLPPGLVEVLEK